MIYVVGLGPGSKDYILPIAIKTINSCDVVIGAKRNLDSISDLSKINIDLGIGFKVIAEYLIKNKEKNIAVVVSGDTGFHSMLAFVKRNIDDEYIKVIPGISSLQYIFSKLNKGYEDAKWVSLHGMDTNLDLFIKDKVPLGILLDKDKNVNYVANLLRGTGANIYIGEKLSYEDEKISKLTVEEALGYKSETLSVVVVDYE